MKKNVSYGIHAAVLAVSVILAVASSFVAYPMSDLKLTCGYGIAAVVLDLVMLLVLKKDNVLRDVLMLAVVILTSLCFCHVLAGRADLMGYIWFLRDFALKQQISKCITAALAHQGVNTPCEINVLVTDDEGIRAINNAYRKIDKATDVLSFPMFELTAGQLPASWEAYKDPDTGLVPLGDMAISLERARQQAAEFGHSARREVGYLTIHSILHLLGYDHLDEGPMKKQMRAAEEAILAEIELPR